MRSSSRVARSTMKARSARPRRSQNAANFVEMLADLDDGGGIGRSDLGLELLLGQWRGDHLQQVIAGGEGTSDRGSAGGER